MLNLTRFQRDTLKEVASIGANSASTALSKLTGKLILVELTKLNLFSIGQAIRVYDDKKNVGVILDVKGGVSGVMLAIASEKAALTIGDLVRRNKPGTSRKLDEGDKDLIKEVGNILVGNYLSALSNMSKLNMIESVPSLMIDSTRNILKNALAKLRGDVKKVIVIENVLIIGRKKIKQEIILILMPESLDKLFNMLFKDLK